MGTQGLPDMGEPLILIRVTGLHPMHTHTSACVCGYGYAGFTREMQKQYIAYYVS